jgi:C4-dicarboxylate-specific signal transduction histidine kinase
MILLAQRLGRRLMPRLARAAVLRGWIAIGTVLMTALLWGGIWFHLQIVRTDDLAEAEHTTSNLARAFEEHIFRTLRNIDQALLRVRAAYAAQPAQFDLEAAIREDGAVTDLIIGSTLINRDGMVVWASTGSQPDLYVGDREQFRYHADNQRDDLFISRPVVGTASGRPTIQITRRIVMADGSFGGVAAVSLDPPTAICGRGRRRAHSSLARICARPRSCAPRR